MTHPAFVSLGQRAIPSLRLKLQDYRHRATGARHVHLACEDNNNVFLVAFRTLPEDSSGVAHILEHTALCGSQRYPVRDPFFMMTRRSLNTFMNAFTSSDWTAYPFATQSPKDFDNLLSVYLDAAFFPLLDELDFAQEGHRLEFAVPDDPDSDLVFKGVVFNEMKGAMSSPVSRLAQALQSNLFPTTTYHHNSGGEPAEIPLLTHAQLKAFHARHYHPSNAVIMTYGDLPVEDHQRRFEALALQRFSRQELNFNVPDERRYRAPIAVDTTYAVNRGESACDKTHIVLGWLLGQNTNPRAVLEARILSDVLLDNSSSPLRRLLETSTLGTAPSPLCGFDDSTREMTFVAGLEGSNPEHADELEQKILSVIVEVAESGVPSKTLESVLHQLELTQREITGDGFPYGLRLILDALTAAIHGGDPASALDLDHLLEELRADVRDPEFIKGLARDLLLDNPHRVRLTMAPEPGLSERQAELERERLTAIKNALEPTQATRIIERTRALASRQAQEDDPERLPRVGLEDVPDELKLPVSEERAVAATPVTWFNQVTNGMVYRRLILDLPELEPSLLRILPLYCLCLTEVGSAGRDYATTQALQAAVTGGLSARCLVRGTPSEIQRIRGFVTLGGKALNRNQSALGDLIADTFARPRFDESSRLRELVAQARAQREENVTHHGHLLALTAASAGISPAASLAHQWEGLKGLRDLKILDDALENGDELEAFAADLDRLHEQLKRAPRRILIVSEAEQHSAIAESLGDELPVYPEIDAAQASFISAPAHHLVRQGWSVNSQVNFCAKAYPTVPQDHRDAPALQVLGNFLRNGFLHRAVREQGGAYGAGAGYDADTGAFRFFSYRDPRLDKTLADFDQAPTWLRTTRHERRALEEAILGVIAAIDRPASPAGEAIGTYFGSLFGRSPEQRREFRRRVLGVTLEDLDRVASKYLVPEQGNVAVLSSKSTLNDQVGLEIVTI